MPVLASTLFQVSIELHCSTLEAVYDRTWTVQGLFTRLKTTLQFERSIE